jgi:hypothetical protein
MPNVADARSIRVRAGSTLKDISVEIPKRRLTVFTGVSGSGNLAGVRTIAASRMAHQRNLQRSSGFRGHGSAGRRCAGRTTTAIIVDQSGWAQLADRRLRDGRERDAARAVQRLGKPKIGPATAFSFNVPTRASGA